MNFILLERWTKKILLPLIAKNKINSAPSQIKCKDTLNKLLPSEPLFIHEGVTYLHHPIDLSIGKPFKE